MLATFAATIARCDSSRWRRRIGELTREMERAPNQHARSNRGTTKFDAIAAAGLSKSEAHRCESRDFAQKLDRI
jgi:hypothetical protein